MFISFLDIIRIRTHLLQEVFHLTVYENEMMTNFPKYLICAATFVLSFWNSVVAAPLGIARFPWYSPSDWSSHAGRDSPLDKLDGIPVQRALIKIAVAAVALALSL